PLPACRGGLARAPRGLWHDRRLHVRGARPRPLPDAQRAASCGDLPRGQAAGTNGDAPRDTRRGTSGAALSLPVVVIGLSHKTAPVDIRERFAAGAEILPELLARLT